MKSSISTVYELEYGMSECFLQRNKFIIVRFFYVKNRKFLWFEPLIFTITCFSLNIFVSDWHLFLDHTGRCSFAIINFLLLINDIFQNDFCGICLYFSVVGKKVLHVESSSWSCLMARSFIIFVVPSWNFLNKNKIKESTALNLIMEIWDMLNMR
jgi:hypothetical protein